MYYGLDGYSFDELLAEAQAELKMENFNNAVLFRMTVWAKGKDVLARRFGDFQGSDVSVYYQSLKTNDRRSIAVELIADGDDVKLSAEFVKSGAAWNGGAELSVTDTYYGGEILRITASCANITYREKLISGNIDVTGEIYEGDDGAFSLSAALDGGGGLQTVTVSGSAYDGYDDWDFGKLTLSYAFSDIDGVTPPALGADRSVTVGDYSEENRRRAYEMSEELYRLAEDYEDNGDDFAAGLLWALAELAEGVGYGYGDDWYDYDDDWYDWYDYYDDYDYGEYDYGYDDDFNVDSNYNYDYGYDFDFGGYGGPASA
jgi:hypothetical protein